VRHSSLEMMQPRTSHPALARGLRSLLTLVAVCLSMILAVEALADPLDDPPSDPFDDPFGDDQLGTDPFGDDPFGIETTDWDSVFASVDDEFAAAQGGPLKPLLSFGYNKAQGVHFGGGVGIGPIWEQRVETGVLYGYDFARRHATLDANVRFGDLIRERGWVEIEGHDDVRSFGSHQPYGNPWFALIGGYDGGSYLRERRGVLRGHWKPRADWTIEATATRAKQSPLRPRADFHLFGSDIWMETGHPSDSLQINGLGFALRHRPRYSEDVILPGIYFMAEGELYGGAVGGDREFSTWMVGARWISEWRDADELHVHLDWALTGGESPTQNLVDLGGAGGLRGLVPRFLVGRQRWFARAEYKWHRDLLRKTRIPFIKKLRLRLVPLVEAGAVWGDRAIHHPYDLKLSDRSDIHWDLGFGLRKTVDSSGFLSYAQLNFVWPMGADTGPPRITVTLSGKGFDTPKP